MTAKQEAWYRNALASFANGSGWEGMKSLTWCAACLGIDPETVVADARAVGKGRRAGDIRRGIRTAIEKGAGRGAPSRPSRPEPERVRTYTGTVRDYVRASAGIEHGDFLDASPLPVWNLSPRDYCAEWLRALWPGDDLLFVTTKGARSGRMGANMRPAREWLAIAERTPGEVAYLGGDLIGVNPYTGKTVRKTAEDGREYDSLISEDCLAPCRPYAVAEFDDMPEPEQLAFWWTFLQRSPLALRLVSLVRSGGKSVHGLLYLSAPDPGARAQRVGILRDLFAVDPETKTRQGRDGRPKTVYPYRLDAYALGAITKTRIPGVLRLGTDRVQSLLYLNPRAAERYRTR